MKNREEIIYKYITAYNNFDVSGMIADLEEGIVFENMENDNITLKLEGLDAFKAQAEKAKSFFSFREQTIESMNHSDNSTEVNINYWGVIASDFPNGLKRGNEIRLKGKSVFVFSESNKILKITDIS